MKTALLILSLLFLMVGTQAQAKKQEPIATKPLELVSLMLKEGDLERTEKLLNNINVNDEKLDLHRFYILSALLNIRLNSNKKAIEFILKAKDIRPVEAVIDVYLAQAAFATENYPLVLEALDSAADSLAKIPSIYHMRAQSYWNLKQRDKALAVLDQASHIFPQNKSFQRRKIFYYLELGYNKQAALLGKEYLQKHSGEAVDYRAMGNALRASGDSESALVFLENAHLKFPNDETIAKSLAAIYLRLQQYYSAAKIIHDISYSHPELIKEAAELYRRAGDRYMALRLSSQINDAVEKTQQRMALFLQFENFEQAAAMENRIKRLKLDRDENMMYALAYAFFKTGKYNKAENQLAQITSATNSKKALKLRNIMQNCKAQAWRCL